MIKISKRDDKSYLRLTIVNQNISASNFYQKYGFKQAKGFHKGMMDDGSMIIELGFEYKII